MRSHELRLPLIVILGPTAVGKTGLSIRLAERLDGEIVSADSRLLYRGMDIGTDKPSLEIRARLPHHLIDVADPDEVWSLAKYQRSARSAIDEIHHRGKIPFLVGGTGQYLRAVTEGWEIPPQRPDYPLRAVLERWAGAVGLEGLHNRLAVVDPEAASRIDPRNLRRTIRALEVILRTGMRFSEQRRRGFQPYRLCILGLNRPRQELYARIDARIQAMIEAGLVEEVQGLLAKGYSPGLASMSAIGYREIAGYLRGESSLEEAVLQIKRRTRQFVRRQANWFKTDDPEIAWFNMEAGTLEALTRTVRQFLDSASS